MPQRLPAGEFARLERPQGRSRTPREWRTRPPLHAQVARMRRQPPFGSSAPAGPVRAIDDGASQTISFGAVRNAKAAGADATAKAVEAEVDPQVSAAYNDAFKKIAAAVNLNQPKDAPETPFSFGSIGGRSYKNSSSPLLDMPPPAPREPRDKWAAIDRLFSQDARANQRVYSRAPTNGEKIAAEAVRCEELCVGERVTRIPSTVCAQRVEPQSYRLCALVGDRGAQATRGLVAWHGGSAAPNRPSAYGSWAPFI